MSSASNPTGLSQIKSLQQIGVLAVQCNPADTLLIREASKPARSIDELRCVPELTPTGIGI
jgi:hypothetical protein